MASTLRKVNKKHARSRKAGPIKTKAEKNLFKRWKREISDEDTLNIYIGFPQIMFVLFMWPSIHQKFS